MQQIIINQALQFPGDKPCHLPGDKAAEILGRKIFLKKN